MSMTTPEGRDFTVEANILARPPIDPATTVVVVVDMVNWQVPRAAGVNDLSPAYYVNRLAETVIPNHERLLAGCRAAGIPILFLRVGSGFANYSDAIPAFKEAFEKYGALDGTFACEVIPELLSEGDLTLLKTGSGGFNSSALDIHLRNMGIKQVIYTGVVTNGCVLLAAAQGFDLGYMGYLVTDATATFTPELQDAAEAVIGFYLAKSVTTDEMLELVGAPVAPVGMP